MYTIMTFDLCDGYINLMAITNRGDSDLIISNPSEFILHTKLVICTYMTGFGETLRMRFAQCAFLVAQVEICQSPDFIIYTSNNPSSNCCRLLRRLVVLYEG